MGYKNKISLLSWEKKIAIFMMVFGFMMMFLIPTWQTPDQRTHLKLIGEEIGNEKFAEIIVDSVNVDSDRLIGNYEEKVDYEQLRESVFAAPEYSRKDLMPQKFNFLVIRHLPTTLGMLAAIIIGVPAFWVLQIGELSSLIFYVLICYYALKIMPIKKELYAMVMLIPMALQQAGGIGYTADDFRAIGEWLRGAEAYFLQNFVDSGALLDPETRGADESEMKEFLEIMKQFIPAAELRGM